MTKEELEALSTEDLLVMAVSKGLNTTDGKDALDREDLVAAILALEQADEPTPTDDEAEADDDDASPEGEK